MTFAKQSVTIKNVFDDVYVGHVCLQHLKLNITPYMVVQFLEAKNFLFHLRFKLKADREQEIKCYKV